MSDFEIVRAWLDYDENRHLLGRDPRSKAHAALDRIEQDVAGLKVELADASARLAELEAEVDKLSARPDWKAYNALQDERDRLRRIEEAARAFFARYRNLEAEQQ